LKSTAQPTKLTRFTNGIAARWNSKSHSGSIIRNMAMLASGTAGAKVIGALSVPVITRIYLPEHMGVLAIFTSLTALLVPFGTLRYSMALPLPKHDGLAMNLAVLCGCSLLAVSLLATLLFWLSAPILLDLLSMQELLPFWWLLPLAIAGTGLYELLSNWAVRDKAFKPLARTKVWQSIIGTITKISLGFLGLKPLGLLIGQVFTQAGGVFSLFITFLTKFKANWRYISKKRLWFLFKRYGDFPKYRLPSQFLLVFSTKAPLFFFAWQFGSESTGQLGLALMVLAMPITLFGQTTGQAYYGEIAKIGRKQPEKIYKITKSITKKLFLISTPPFLALLFFGPWLFEIVFGDIWREAGFFASILALYLLTQFVSNPLVNAMTVFEKQGMFFLINLVRLVGIIFVFSISYRLILSPGYTMLVYSLSLSLYYIFTAYIVFRVIRNAKL
jgi:O-antigen/teichoic acid export membrane protein